jgi:hypothetical protein
VDYRQYHPNVSRNIGPIKELYNQNPEDFYLARFYVKTLIRQHRDSLISDLKQSFNDLKEAERINDEILVKKHNYNKLNNKFLTNKIKYYDMFFQPDKFQNLMSQALRDIGMKTYKTSTVMAVMAEYNSKRGDHEKAIQYINRALKILNEVLDGVKIHKKYVYILGVKGYIYQRKKSH